MPALMPTIRRVRHQCRRLRDLLYVGLGLTFAACQPQRDQSDISATPPVGHYEGSITAVGQPEVRGALDIRHPSPGHYEAELTVPTASTLSFVADTILFSNNQLRLARPGHPSQTLTLKLDGDFWRGALALDSAQALTILVKRGVPSPSAYRVEKVLQAAGTAWLFAPSDTGTPGAALVLMPDADTAPTAALWADALARAGIIVLLLPAVDMATITAETVRLQAALHLLRGTAGANTANVGAWAAGPRATTLAQVLTESLSLGPAFFIAQNPDIDATGRTAFRELKRRNLPILGLYGGPMTNRRAAAMRNAVGGRRGATVRAYRTAGSNLLVPSGLGPRFGPGLPADVVEWLRSR